MVDNALAVLALICMVVMWYRLDEEEGMTKAILACTSGFLLWLGLCVLLCIICIAVGIL